MRAAISSNISSNLYHSVSLFSFLCTIKGKRKTAQEKDKSKKLHCRLRCSKLTFLDWVKYFLTCKRGRSHVIFRKLPKFSNCYSTSSLFYCENVLTFILSTFINYHPCKILGGGGERAGGYQFNWKFNFYGVVSGI